MILHLETGEYHGINEVGCAIWELIDGDRSVDDVIAAVRGKLEDAPPSLADDVRAFLDGMRERDLLVA